MPKGIYSRARPNEVIIDVQARSGWRGRLDRLRIEFADKARALALAAQILDDDERRAAQDAFPQKLLHATTQRGNGKVPTTRGPYQTHKKKRTPRQSLTVRVEAARAYIDKHPNTTTRQVATALGVNESYARKVAAQVAKPSNNPRARQPVQWVLR